MASKEAYKEHLLKEIAKNTGANFHDLRNNAHQELRSERVGDALYYGISQGDADADMTQTTSSGVQAEAQTSSSGVQAEPERTSQGAQTRNPTTRDFETQVTEDRSEEIEKIKTRQ